MSFFKKKKQPELIELQDTPEKGDTLAMTIAAFVTIILPISLMLLVILVIALLFVR